MPVSILGKSRTIRLQVLWTIRGLASSCLAPWTISVVTRARRVAGSSKDHDMVGSKTMMIGQGSVR